MDKVYIVSAVRTAVGKSRAGSAITHVRPDDMAAVVIREAVKRSGIGPGENSGLRSRLRFSRSGSGQ